VDHQAEPREPAAAFEEPAQVAGQTDPLARDAVDRAAGREHVRLRERRDARVVAIVGVGDEIDRLLGVLDHADLVAEREVDRCGPELIGQERRDHEPARVELGADRVAREDRHRGLGRVIGRRMIPQCRSTLSRCTRSSPFRGRSRSGTADARARCPRTHSRRSRAAHRTARS
jgi:hypothetical protein